MTSERQRAANQANARHSTGPKTQNGKAIVRLNALRHGILARDVVLPGEDADAYDDLVNQIQAELLPAGPIEELLTDRVITIIWRLRRSARAETALLDWRARVLKVSQLEARCSEIILAAFDSGLPTKDKKALARAKQECDGEELLLGRALDVDAKAGDTLGKLARYESSLERSLFRALEELRQLQDRHRNRPSPPILDAITVAAGDDIE
jgi:hypothetical protein